MERIQTQVFLKMAAIFAAAAACSALVTSAQAATVLARPEPAMKLAPGESYPDSSFGRKPQRGFASTETEALDTSDEQGGARAPAGLVFRSVNEPTLEPLDRERGPGVRVDEMGRGREARVATRFEEAKAVQPDRDSVEPASAIARKGVQEVAIIAGDLGFFPKTVFVNRDIPVRLFVTGASKSTLCLMMDSFQVRKQVRSQKIEEITFTPNLPGKYRFYCPVGGMEGTLIVKELATAVAVTEDGRAPASASDGRNINEAGDRAPSSASAPARPPEGVREE